MSGIGRSADAFVFASIAANVSLATIFFQGGDWATPGWRGGLGDSESADRPYLEKERLWTIGQGDAPPAGAGAHSVGWFSSGGRVEPVSLST